MHKKVNRYARIIGGSIMFLLGFLGTIAGLFSILDPIGSKMADDSDPFGQTPTFIEDLTTIAVYLLVLALGTWLLFSRRFKEREGNGVYNRKIRVKNG